MSDIQRENESLPSKYKDRLDSAPTLKIDPNPNLTSDEKAEMFMRGASIGMGLRETMRLLDECFIPFDRMDDISEAKSKLRGALLITGGDDEK